MEWSNEDFNSGNFLNITGEEALNVFVRLNENAERQQFYLCFFNPCVGTDTLFHCENKAFCFAVRKVIKLVIMLLVAASKPGFDMGPIVLLYLDWFVLSGPLSACQCSAFIWSFAIRVVAVIPRKNSPNQVAKCIQTALKPKGVAILIGAQHQCMTTRGLPKLNVTMLTMRFTGVFRNDPV